MLQKNTTKSTMLCSIGNRCSESVAVPGRAVGLHLSGNHKLLYSWYVIDSHKMYKNIYRIVYKINRRNKRRMI